MLTMFKTDVGWGQYRNVEMGVSYDHQAVAQLSSEDDLKGVISEAVEICSNIFRANYKTGGDDIEVWLARLQKINVNTNSSKTLSQSASFYWNSSADVCNTVDVAIHITGANMGGEGGAWQDGFCLTNRQNLNDLTVGWVEVSSFSTPERLAFAIAHELGHQLGLSHENHGFSFMNEVVLLPQPFNANSILLGSENRNTFRQKLNSKACLLESNINQMVEGCANCEDKIIISRGMEDEINELEFGCGSHKHEFDHQLSFTNSCTQKRNVTIELEFHPDHITFTQLPDIFEGPYFKSSPSERPYYYVTKEPIELDENQGNVLDFSVRVGPQGHLGENMTGAFLYVVYKLDIPGEFRVPGYNVPNFRSLMIQPYIYKYNYQLDYRNLPRVQASQLQIPDPVDPLNFCFGTTSFLGSRSFDVYMGGELYIDMSQEYCKTHFFFPPGGRLVVGKNKSLTLNNCTLTTCDGLWEGIVLEEGAELILNNTEISNAITGVKAKSNNSQRRPQLSINKSRFLSNQVGLDLEKTNLRSIYDVEFNKGFSAIRLEDCFFVDMEKINISHYQNGIRLIRTYANIKESNILEENSFGIGIYSSDSHVVRLNDVNISGFRFGIEAIQSGVEMIEGNISNCIVANRISNNQINSYIYDVTFSQNIYGVILSNSNPKWDGNYLESSIFENTGKGIGIFNCSSPQGVGIFENNIFNSIHGLSAEYGVKAYNSTNVYSSFNNIQVASPNNSAGIEYLGTSLGSMYGNIIHKGGTDADDLQISGIRLHNAGAVNVECNDVSGGSFGINVWGDAMGGLLSNDISSSNNGLYYGLYPSNGYAVTGIQNHMQNKWDNGSMGVAAKHLSNDDNHVFLSRFLVDRTKGQQYWPEPIAATTNDWFRDELTSISYNRICYNNWEDQPARVVKDTELIPSYAFSPEDIKPSDVASQKVALKETQTREIPSQMTLISAPQNTEISWDTAWLNALVSGHIHFGPHNEGVVSNSLYKYYQTHLSFPEKNILSPSIVNNIENRALISELALLERKILHELSEDEVAYLNFMNNSVVLGYEPPTELVTSAIRGEESETLRLKSTFARDFRINSAIYSLQNLSTNDPVFANKVSLLLIQARLLKGDILSPHDMATLNSIAYQCPLTGGDAVYGARGLLAAETLEEVHYADFALCEVVEPRSLRTNSNQLNVYPNPSHGRIQVECTDVIQQLSIFNAQGDLLETYPINATSHTIDGTSLSSGIYFMQVKTEKGEILTHKFLKIE